MKYKLIKNYCNCHPETCGCNPWVIIDSTGDKISSHYCKDKAEKLLRVLNENS